MVFDHAIFSVMTNSELPWKILVLFGCLSKERSGLPLQWKGILGWHGNEGCRLLQGFNFSFIVSLDWIMLFRGLFIASNPKIYLETGLVYGPENPPPFSVVLKKKRFFYILQERSVHVSRGRVPGVVELWSCCRVYDFSKILKMKWHLIVP